MVDNAFATDEPAAGMIGLLPRSYRHCVLQTLAGGLLLLIVYYGRNSEKTVECLLGNLWSSVITAIFDFLRHTKHLYSMHF